MKITKLSSKIKKNIGQISSNYSYQKSILLKNYLKDFEIYATYDNTLHILCVETYVR